MEQTISLEQWLNDHKITHTIRHDILVVAHFGRCLIMEDYDHIFKKNNMTGDMEFNLPENKRFLVDDDILYVVFPFGNRWYYIDLKDDLTKCQFHILRWIGPTPTQKHNIDFYPLGVHSGYELLNGSGLIKDWCAKAKWLGYKGIGTSDKNTMAASLDLQTSATAKELKFVNGYSCTVNLGTEKIGVKIYAQTQEGFQNLLRIQKAVCVDNDNKELNYLELLNRGNGNVLVFDKLCGNWLAKELASESTELDAIIKAFDGWVYFQVDTTEYKADRIDSQVLISTKAYFDAFYNGELEYEKNVRPILIQDMYYIDSDDWKNKMILNKVDTGAAHEQSNRQFMKTVDELYDEWRNLFSDKYPDDVFEDMRLATTDIVENATAAYDLTENYAPRYDMTEAEMKKYGNELNMFHTLIEQGFTKLVPEGEEKRYRERVEYEEYVIESTDNVSYFLIQWDEVNYAREHGILVGLGRGSAGGCLLLYLMGITQIDPLKYGLIFERFLLPERAGLAPREATKMQDDIDSNNYVELELENGKTYKFDIDAQFLINRNGKEIKIYADELEDGDDIIWDRCTELWKL